MKETIKTTDFHYSVIDPHIDKYLLIRLISQLGLEEKKNYYTIWREGYLIYAKNRFLRIWSHK